MLNRRSKKIIAMLLVGGALALAAIHVNAKPDYTKPTKIRATCYLPTGNRCATGVYPRHGITVAGKREWFGKTCILYHINKDGSIGKLIGYFVVEDTGGYFIRNGIRIDVYRDTMDEARAWIKKHGDYVYMQLLNSEG